MTFVRGGRTWPIVSQLIVAVALAYFAFAAGREIAMPGLYYDEVLFVNAATGAASDSFIAARLFGVPVMLMDYIGALKAYLFYPIFKVFGVSAATVRWPAIAFSLVSLWCAFETAKFSINPMASAAVVVAMAADPALIYMVKVDFGPIVLMMLFKLLALMCLFNALSACAPRFLWAFAISCILGVFDKLNFIWFVIALAVASILLFRTEWFRLYQRHRGNVLAAFGLLVVVLGTAVLYRIVPQFIATQRTPSDLVGRAHYLLGLYQDTMSGAEFYRWITDSELTAVSVTNWVTLAAVATVLTLGTIRLRKAGALTRLPFTERVVACYVVLFAVIALQILVTKKANGPHHIMMLYPFHHLIAVAAAVWVGALLTERTSLAVVTRLAGNFGVVMLATGLLVVSGQNVNREYTQALRADRDLSPRWSPLIYDLVAYLNRRDADTILFPDWGIHNQVYALGTTDTRLACRDVWQLFATRDTPARAMDAYHPDFRGKRVLAVLHSPEGEVMAGSRAVFFAWLDNRGLTARLERTLSSRSGRPIFEVYWVEGPGSAGPRSSRSPGNAS